jgi:hypothetical protein
VSDNAVIVAEGDAASLAIVFHRLSGLKRIDEMPSYGAFPWVQALAYWATKVNSLPTIVRGSRKHDIGNLWVRELQTRAFDAMVGDVMNTMSAI